MPRHLNKTFVKGVKSSLLLRSSYHKLKKPFAKYSSKFLVFHSSSIVKKISGDIKKTITSTHLNNTLKIQNLKKIGNRSFKKNYYYYYYYYYCYYYYYYYYHHHKSVLFILLYH